MRKIHGFQATPVAKITCLRKWPVNVVVDNTENSVPATTFLKINILRETMIFLQNHDEFKLAPILRSRLLLYRNNGDLDLIGFYMYSYIFIWMKQITLLLYKIDEQTIVQTLYY